MWMSSEQDPLCTSPNEESGHLANNAPLTGYEPNFFDDFHYSETTEIFLQEKPSDTVPSYLHDAEINDDTICRVLSSPLFTQEREEPANQRQAYHSLEESMLPSQSLSVCLVRTVRPVHELSSLGSSIRENPSRDSENEQIRILLERQKEQILADCRAEVQKHEFQADYGRRSIQELNGIIESQRSEINHGHAGDEQLRRDQQLLHEQLLEQNRYVREAHMKSLNEMEELKRFQGSTFDGFSRRKLIEDRDTILELTAKIQELQNEVNCMSDSRDFKDAESVRSGQSHVTSQPAFFPPRDPGGMLSRSLGMPSRNDRPPSIWDTHGMSGNVFANPTASSSESYPQESNPWISNVSEHTSPHVIVNAKHQTQPWIRDASQDRQPEIHSTLVREDSQRIMGQTNNVCRFRILILTNSPTHQHLLVGR